MGNVEHLAQLEGDAREVATEACRLFPGFVITSSRRDVQSQAVAMARNVARQRTWILGDAHAEPPIKATYRWSTAAMLCHNWAIAADNADAREPEIAAAFAGILNQLPVRELARMSRHLAPVTAGAHAFDAKPLITPHGAAMIAAGSLDPELTAEGREIVAYLTEQARKRGGAFLTVEGKLVVHHWQAKD